MEQKEKIADILNDLITALGMPTSESATARLMFIFADVFGGDPFDEMNADYRAAIDRGLHSDMRWAMADSLIEAAKAYRKD